MGGWPDRDFSRALTEAERLDKIGHSWQMLPALNTGRGNLAAAALHGRLYAIGGYDQAGDPLTVVEALAPGHDTAWSAVAALPQPRGACAAAATRDRIYVTGGDNDTTDPSFDSLVAFDPEAGHWQAKAPMITPRSNLKMVYLDPYIYAIGGIGTGPHDPPLDTVERYDPRNDTWTTVAPMHTGRVNVGTAVVGNQIVVVGGGSGQDFGHLQPLPTSEIYNPGTNTWMTLDWLLNPGRGGITSATVSEDTAEPEHAAEPKETVLAIGGAFSTAQGFVMTKEVDRSPSAHHHH
jgi:N-acetylneuraminic acid mutarotase